jgi:hypothetical protein
VSPNHYTPVNFEPVSDVSLTEREYTESSHSTSEHEDRQEIIDAYPDEFEAFSSTYDGLIAAIQYGSPDAALDALNVFDAKLRDRPDAARQLDDEILLQAGQGNPENHLRLVKQCTQRVFDTIVGDHSTSGTKPVRLAWHLHIPTTEESIPKFEPNKAQAYLRDLGATHAHNHTGNYGNELEQALQDQLSQLGYSLGNRWFVFSTTDPDDSGRRELDIKTRFSGEDVILEVFTGSAHLKDRQVRDYTRLYAIANDSATRPHAIHVTDTRPTTIPVEVMQLLLSERPDKRPAQIGQRDSHSSFSPSLITDDIDETDKLEDIIKLLNSAEIEPDWVSLNIDPDETTAPYPVARVDFIDTTVYLGFHDEGETGRPTNNDSKFSLAGGDMFYWVNVSYADYEQGKTIATIHPDVLLALLYLGKPFEAMQLGAIESHQSDLIGRNIAYKTDTEKTIEAEVLDIYSEGTTQLWIELNINGLGTRVDAAGDSIEQCINRPNNWAKIGQYNQLYLRNPCTLINTDNT